jgi:lipopolysaccharide biosynthesis regulator YciM
MVWTDEKRQAEMEGFRRRRVREALAAVVVVVAIVWAALATYDRRGGPIGSWRGLTALAVVVGYFVFHALNWRCPACGRYMRQFDWRRPSCAECGAALAASPDARE